MCHLLLQRDQRFSVGDPGLDQMPNVKSFLIAGIVSSEVILL